MQINIAGGAQRLQQVTRNGEGVCAHRTIEFYVTSIWGDLWTICLAATRTLDWLPVTAPQVNLAIGTPLPTTIFATATSHWVTHAMGKEGQDENWAPRLTWRPRRQPSQRAALHCHA